jgi:hypothetical protein
MIKRFYGLPFIKTPTALLLFAGASPPPPPPDVIDGESWAPGVYTYSQMIVYYVDVDGIAHALRLAAGVPFTSSNLLVEYQAGIWRRMGGSMQILKSEFIPANSVPALGLGTGPNGLILKGDIFRIGGLISTDGNGRELIGGASWLQATKDDPGVGPEFWKINNGLS